MTASALHRRPQTKFAAALAAAGVVSAVSVAGIPAQPALPTISVDVVNASTVTDSLTGLGTGVAVLDSLVGLHVDAVISLPFEASLAVLAAAQHPEVAPNVLSYLVQRFVNPAVGPPIAAYPWETEQIVALFATLLLYPLGPSATDPGLVNQARFAFADVFNSVLGQLPDPMPGYEAVQDVSNNTVLGGAIVAGQNLVRTPLYTAWTAADFLGNLPASLAANPPTPGQLPELAGNLIHGLFSPVNHAPEANAGATNRIVSSLQDLVPPSIAPVHGIQTRRGTTPFNVKALLSRDASTPASEADNSVPKGGKHRAVDARSGFLRHLIKTGNDQPAAGSGNSSDDGA
jgi:hypothetical protein